MLINSNSNLKNIFQDKYDKKPNMPIKYIVNGQIDESFSQGGTGDCWLLSGVLALNNTEEGKEIIKNAISTNDDGSYNVYFKGVDKSYNITAEELKAVQQPRYDENGNQIAYQYSMGDEDMILIELATSKLINDESIQEKLPLTMRTNGIEAGNPLHVYGVLAGYSYEGMGQIRAKDFTKAEWDLNLGTNMTLASGEFESEKPMAGNLIARHGYMIKSINQEKGEMILVNPHNTKEEITEKISDLADDAVIQFSKVPLYQEKINTDA